MRGQKASVHRSATPSREIGGADAEVALRPGRGLNIGETGEFGAVVERGNAARFGGDDGPEFGGGIQFVGGEEFEAEIQGVGGTAELEAGEVLRALMDPDEIDLRGIGLSRVGTEGVFLPVQASVLIRVGVGTREFRLVAFGAGEVEVVPAEIGLGEGGIGRAR